MTSFTVETKVTHKYLMGKSKSQLADDYLNLCDVFDKTWNEMNRLRKENDDLKLQLAQAKAAISIIDPAMGTGSFLANPPYGEKDGEE